MAILDPSGNPYPPNLQANTFEVRIDESGKPTLPNGSSILGDPPQQRGDSGQFNLPPSERMDGFLGNSGPGGYGWPGYRGATFQNQSTGVGTMRDKTTYGNYWAPWRILDSELLAMYNGNDIAAQVIEAAPMEMFRRGWEVHSRDLDDDDIKALDKKAADLRLNELMLEGMIWGRLFGGALNIIGAEDGNNPDTPLDEDSIKTFHYLNVVDRRFVWVQRYYSDQLSPKYGLPEIYLITNVVSHGGMYGTTNPPPGIRLAAVSIHESRLIRYDGAKTDVLTRQQLAGWTWSVLQRCYDALRRFDNAQNSVDNLLADASQAVFKIRNLMEMIANNQKDQVVARMQMADLGRSVMRAVMVDAEAEDFKREPTSFAGIPDLMDRQMQRVASAAKMPVTKLFGRSPAGMNATGESDIRMWLDQIRSMQENELGPKIKRLYTLMAKAKDQRIKIKTKKGDARTTAWDRVNANASTPANGIMGNGSGEGEAASKAKENDPQFQVQFTTLWEPTALEDADRGLKIAQRDQILIDEGVITPEQAALGMFGSGKLSDWVDVDSDALQKTISGAVKFDPYSNQPLPTGALVGAAEQGEAQTPVVPLPLPGAVDLAGAQRLREAESPQRTTERPNQPDKPSQATNAREAGASPPSGAKPLVSKSTIEPPDKDEDGNPIPRKAKSSKDAYDQVARPIRADHVALQDPEVRNFLETVPHAFTTKQGRMDSDSIATAVRAQMENDYEPELLDWVLSAHWTGPKRVPLDRIDFSNQDKWQATHDPVHVKVMKDRIEQGIEKPIILVKIPSSKKMLIVDGHHRGTAYDQLEKNPRAYIATVTTDHGPWDHLHTMQRESLMGSAQKGK